MPVKVAVILFVTFSRGVTAIDRARARGLPSGP